MVPNNENKGDYYANSYLSQLIDNFDSKKWWEVNFFSYETKAFIHLSEWVEWIYGAQSLKKRRLLYESLFTPIQRWNLILKFIEREVVLMKPKLLFIYPNHENEFLEPNY